MKTYKILASLSLILILTFNFDSYIAAFRFLDNSGKIASLSGSAISKRIISGSILSTPVSGTSAGIFDFFKNDKNPASPQPKENPGQKSREESAKKYVALTFDDGPSSASTPKLIEILKKNKVKATFFVIGKNAEQNRDVLEQLYKSGFEIGNHSYSHKLFSRLSQAKKEAEIDKCNGTIYEVTGKTPHILRAPGGESGKNVLAAAKSKDMALINWNIDPRDWASKNPAKITNQVVSKVRPGSIVLLHDVYKTTVSAVPGIIAQLSDKGYTFVTVTELLNHYQGVEPGAVYFNGELE